MSVKQVYFLQGLLLTYRLRYNYTELKGTLFNGLLGNWIWYLNWLATMFKGNFCFRIHFCLGKNIALTPYSHSRIAISTERFHKKLDLYGYFVGVFTPSDSDTNVGAEKIFAAGRTGLKLHNGLFLVSLTKSWWCVRETVGRAYLHQAKTGAKAKKIKGQ